VKGYFDNNMNNELLELVTQQKPFRFVDTVQNIDPESVRGVLKYGNEQNRCYSTYLEMWVCIEMLAQLAGIHNRWLESPSTKKKDGLMAKIENFSFFPSPLIKAGLLVYEVKRWDKIATFIKYSGTVSYNDTVIANGTITLYANEAKNGL
jgi:3-hydroxymyristoyl/3-hydroxydecanoyl-(acyl carrier protein) dehydratase